MTSWSTGKPKFSEEADLVALANPTGTQSYYIDLDLGDQKAIVELATIQKLIDVGHFGQPMDKGTNCRTPCTS